MDTSVDLNQGITNNLGLLNSKFAQLEELNIDEKIKFLETLAKSNVNQNLLSNLENSGNSNSLNFGGLNLHQNIKISEKYLKILATDIEKMDVSGDAEDLEPNSVQKQDPNSPNQDKPDQTDDDFAKIMGCDPLPKKFTVIEDNIFYVSKSNCKVNKDERNMVCYCKKNENFDATDASSMDDASSSQDDKNYNCVNDCINKDLFIECNPETCPTGEFCQNQRLQKKMYAGSKVFYANEKGHGLMATRDIQPGELIMEYIGDVISDAEHQNRITEYEDSGIKHHFFMEIKKDYVIDATKAGNISRFINHSCNPNAKTEKWTVLGMIRIAFAATKVIKQGEEITFDYQFVSYGEKEQKCYCGSKNCRGVLGRKKQQSKSKKNKDSIYEEEPELMIDLNEKADILKLLRQMHTDCLTDETKSPILPNIKDLFVIYQRVI